MHATEKRPNDYRVTASRSRLAYFELVNGRAFNSLLDVIFPALNCLLARE